MENVSNAPVFPVIIIIALAFGVGCAFLDVWDMVIDTIFQCYCMDEEYGTGKSPGIVFNMICVCLRESRSLLIPPPSSPLSFIAHP